MELNLAPELVTMPLHTRAARNSRVALLVGASLAASLALVPISREARAEVKLASPFQAGMVLQRDRPIPVWGVAEPGATVAAALAGKSAETKAGEDGRWRLDLDPLPAGGPHALVVESDGGGGTRIELGDVLIGEVWIASGQSNMQWTIAQIAPDPELIANCADDQLRFLTPPRVGKAAPADSVDAKWQRCAPETIPAFSAVAYFFAKDLREALGVPIGILNTNYGGTPAEAWTRATTLATYPELAHYTKNLEERLKAPNLKNEPGVLYNGMIAPLAPYAIRGAIWYQGESNAGRAWEYRTLFPAMIHDWRDVWGQGDFPFLLVQLAPFKAIVEQPTESDWAELREAQFLATKITPNTAQVVITDAGDPNDIHPKNKQPVGRRLALAARALAYGECESLVWSGPEYDRLEILGDRAIVHFRHVGSGLVAKDGPLKGFTLAGRDGKFVNAEARIDGNAVVVTAKGISHPVAVRYGWADYPVVNLFNKEGLPATPFRTDVAPGVTRKVP